jgi:hypothetical protein
MTAGLTLFGSYVVKRGARASPWQLLLVNAVTRPGSTVFGGMSAVCVIAWGPGKTVPRRGKQQQVQLQRHLRRMG